MKNLFIIFLLSFGAYAHAQSLYYPPLSGAAQWETLSPTALGWCPDKIDSLYAFLERENTKGFIVLKDGRIVLERYFGTFTSDSLWYWASAGKTLTAFLVGKAQEEGKLSLSDPSSTYLGSGWTACTPAQEAAITIRHQLTMSSGLDDGVPDNHCTIDTCLRYLAAPATRWAYHNAPYTLLEKVVESATGKTINIYTQQTLKMTTLTGISGLWLKQDYDNVFYSKVRSMARFGLLMQGNGIWKNDTLLRDTAYLHAMRTPSQPMNKSYGYLCWLNGSPSYMVPTSQLVFPGSYAPDAPADMFAGLGKNGQIVSIAPSKGLVVVRMGNKPNSPLSEVPLPFCNQIWQRLNEAMCSTGVSPAADAAFVRVFPNPISHQFTVSVPQQHFAVSLFDMQGRQLFSQKNAFDAADIPAEALPAGIYSVQICMENQLPIIQKIVK